MATATTQPAREPRALSINLSITCIRLSGKPEHFVRAHDLLGHCVRLHDKRCEQRPVYSLNTELHLNAGIVAEIRAGIRATRVAQNTVTILLGSDQKTSLNPPCQ